MTVNRLLCFFAVSDITFEQFEFKNRVIAIAPSSIHLFNIYRRTVRCVKSLSTSCTVYLAYQALTNITLWCQ